MIPFFASSREFEALKNEFIPALEKTYSTGQFLQGKDVTDFETRVAGLAHRKFGIAVNSCTDALYFALLASGVRPGDEVLVTDFSFVASASCITRAGAVPVFVDVDETYNIDLAKAGNSITSKTKVLILVHLYGQMNDPAAAEAFCRKNKLTLIEDAAQAIGASWDGRPAGSLGMASCISFDPTKPISAPGSGGIVLTDNEDAAERVRRLRYHGKDSKSGSFIEMGFNSQMPTGTAAFLNVKLKYHEKWLVERQSIARELVKGLSGVPGVVVPRETRPKTHIYHKFVIRHSKRNALADFLKQKGVQTMVHYQLPLHKQPCFAAFSNPKDDYSKALHFADNVLSLPIHPFVTSAEVATIVDAVKAFPG